MGMNAETLTKDLDKYQLHDIWLMHHKGRGHKMPEEALSKAPGQGCAADTRDSSGQYDQD